MAQRLSGHVAQETGPGEMAAYAPSGAVTQAVAVIHLLGSPVCRAQVARITGHHRSIEQLRVIGNVIGRLARPDRTVVAGRATARCHDNRRVQHSADETHG